MDKKVDRDYLGIEDVVKENVRQDEVSKSIESQRRKRVQSTLDTTGWRKDIEPFLLEKTMMKAVDPKKEGWEREYLAHYALVTVATELLGVIRHWAGQQEEGKDA